MSATRSLALLATAAAVVVTIACSSGSDGNVTTTTVVNGSGVMDEESRAVSGFSGVTLSAVGDLTITQGAAESLTVRAEDNLLEYIETRVSGNTLSLSFRPGVDVRQTREIEFDLTVVDLERVAITGVGDVTCAELDTSGLTLVLSGVGEATFDRLSATGSVSIDLSGVGDVTVTDLLANRLDVSLGGVGEITVAGTVVDQTVTITGVGNYDGSSLSSVTADVTLDSEAAVEAIVRISGSLTAAIHDQGHVWYIADGAPVVTETTATGRVDPLP